MTATRRAIHPFDEALLADPYAHHPLLRDTGPVGGLEPVGAFGIARFDEVPVLNNTLHAIDSLPVEVVTA